MSRLVVFRQAARMAVAGVGPGACIYTAYALRPSPIRLDAGPAPPFTHRLRPRPRISSSAVQQLSSGSLAGKGSRSIYSVLWSPMLTTSHTCLGFGAGVLVALFSRTLAFVAGLLALSIYVSLN